MNTIIIEDHPIIMNFYVDILSNEYRDNISITQANTASMAYEILNSENSFDLAIIDYSLPPHTEKNIYSGADIAEMIRKKSSLCKIVIITSHTEILLVYDMILKIDPEGIAIKTDVNADEFLIILNDVISGNKYKSKLIKQFMLSVWEKKVVFEKYNRKILFYLSKGYKIKELCDLLSLSESTIQRRLMTMKKSLGVKDESSLIKAAIGYGYI